MSRKSFVTAMAGDPLHDSFMVEAAALEEKGFISILLVVCRDRRNGKEDGNFD